jgi:hypothetical protein
MREEVSRKCVIQRAKDQRSEADICSESAPNTKHNTTKLYIIKVLDIYAAVFNLYNLQASSKIISICYTFYSKSFKV